MIAVLVHAEIIGPDTKSFLFEVPEVEQLDYLPGQFVSFNELVLGKHVTRAYSISSAPSGNRFELCLNRVQDGLFSPYLFALAPGARVLMAGPLGYFTPRTPFRDSVLIATGTGIAPFRAYLQDARVLTSSAAITLLSGARLEAGLLYRTEFTALAESRPGFRYLPSVTRPQPGWAGRTGRVQAHLDEALAGRKDLDIYLCGLKAMVDSVRAELKARGFDRHQIIYEKYD